MKYLHNSVKTKQSFIRVALIAVGIILLSGLVFWFGTERWYIFNLRPRTSESQEIFFVVEEGTSKIDIANSLENKKVIKDATAFIWYIERLDTDVVLQAGSYRLDSAYSVSRIADILISGKIDQSLFTIVPGWRLDQIKKKFIDAGYKSEDVDKAFLADYNQSILKFKPAEASLEGYIYPETLQITAKSTPTNIINRHLDIFDELVNDNIKNGLKKQKLSVHQAIILASIVQQEVSDPEDQRKVAQVYIKRLAEDMPLQADPTFRYAAKMFGGPENSSNESKYNTYQHKGLPPGPIANFNLSALIAVANPAETDYLYFVSGDDKITRFSKTLEEHNKNVEKYCIDLCKL